MRMMLILLTQRRAGCDAIRATGPSHSHHNGAASMKVSQLTVSLALIMALIASVLLALESPQNLSAIAGAATLEGRAAYGNWRSDAPGIRRQIKAEDLPAPYASFSHATFPTVVKRPAEAQLKVAPGLEVRLFASGLVQPRLIRVAPNGDIFVAESAAGRIRVLRPADSGDQVSDNEIFVSGLKLPFGIAFYPMGSDPQWIYVANTDSVVRFPYRNGDLHANNNPQVIVPTLPTGRGHWTRDIAFSHDDSKMFVSVGSASNASESTATFDLTSPGQWIDLLRWWIGAMLYGAASGDEIERAAVLEFDPNGRGRRIYASGIRNCVGMAVNYLNGDLWCSTNERDGLGDDLPPDYVTRVRADGFYGWPWYYIGANEDPRHKGARPDLKDKIIVPDVLIQPHSAPLQMVFHSGRQFPAEYKGNIFVAQHGSWNRAKPTGYKISRVIVHDGAPTGEYEDFVTGFVIDDTHVWGRPVGVAEATDGSLLFSEDANGTIWRITSKRSASVQ